MTNKYLEKIAKQLDNDDKKSRSRAWGTFGRSVGYGTLAGLVPVPGANIAGGIYGYREGLKKHAPSVKKEDLTSHAIRGYARKTGRGIVEGIGGAAAGGGAAVGITSLMGKLRKVAPHKIETAANVAGIIGAGVGSLAGGIHGGYKSTKNKLDELNKKKNQD